MSLPAILSGISQVAGLFGKGPSIDTAGVNRATGKLNDLSTTYGNMAAPYTGNVGTDAAAARTATSDYSKYLTTDPATEQYNAAQYANLNGGAGSTFQRLSAQLRANNAARGILPGSSIDAGQQADITTRMAGQDAATRNQIALGNEARHASNLAENTNLLESQAQRDFSNGSAATGAQVGIQDNLASIAERQALQKYQQDQNDQTAFDTNAQGLGQTLGRLFTPKAAGAAPVAPGMSPNYNAVPTVDYGSGSPYSDYAKRLRAASALQF